MPRLIGTSPRKRYIVSSTSASTPVSASFSGKRSNAALRSTGIKCWVVCSTTSGPCRLATSPHALEVEPAGYSFSQNGTKFRSAARAKHSTSGTPINTISCPRDCSLRASAVMGFKCPDNGILKKPIFIIHLSSWSELCLYVLFRQTLRSQPDVFAPPEDDYVMRPWQLSRQHDLASGYASLTSSCFSFCKRLRMSG